MEDKSRMFKDFNIKLAVINSLLQKRASFIQEFEKLKNTEEMIPFLENILLTDEDMDKVNCIQIGDNLEIYKYIPIDFDKEIQTLDDLDILYNLKSIQYE